MQHSIIQIERVNPWDDDLFICTSGLVLQTQGKIQWVIET
jgi:hypothetical protein